MNDTEALPRKVTIEISYDARDPEEHTNSQGLLAHFLAKWNYGGNRFEDAPADGGPSTEIQDDVIRQKFPRPF